MKAEFLPPIKRYVNAIERHLRLPFREKVRVMEDISSAITARHEAGESYEQIMADMGKPRQVAAQFNREMGARPSRVRWVLLVLAVAVLPLTAILLIELGMVFWFQHWIASSSAASIGIIGGADGPTAIFVAQRALGLWDWFLAFLAGSPAVCLGLIGWFCRLSGWQRAAKRLAWVGLASHLVWLAVCLAGQIPAAELAAVGLGLGLWLCLGLLWKSRCPKDAKPTDKE